MRPTKPIDDQSDSNRLLLWLVFFGALAWGLLIGVGAFLQDPLRGLIVFGVVLLLTGLWALALLKFQRRKH